MRDPFPKVNGGGLAILREAGVDVELGVACDAAAELNAPYLKLLSTGLPYVTAKWAMTLDGKTSTSSGESKWISGESSRALVHHLRGRMDAIVIGITTAIADDPLLTARPPGPRIPVRIILDSRARLPASSQLAQTAREVPVLIAATDLAPREQRCELERLGCEIAVFAGNTQVAIKALLAELGRRAMTNVLVEGGGRVLGSFLDSGQIDAVDVYIAPILEGGDHSRTAVRGQGVERMNQSLRLERPTTKVISGDVHVQGILPRPWRRILSDLGTEVRTEPPFLP
jgi:diaminohydroxyphosphoribosylaminopyrimidine deaminase/5-amino-6-(5-phosphoribosylamino)uracil reductase